MFYLREGLPRCGPTVRVAGVSTSTNRIRLDLAGPPGTQPARLAFEAQSGYLIASLERPGWLGLGPGSACDLPTGRPVVEAALAGLYARAGAQLVRDWLRADLAPNPFDIDDRGLVAWPGDGEVEILYDLEQSPTPADGRAARFRPGPDATPARAEAARVRLDANPIPWPAWVAFWEKRPEAPPPPPPFTTRPLLPSG
ncbi:MAG: hypothetical protein U0800_03045 [Isosphaeraceae bacterium]